ncbi:MAG: aminopeptidase P family protein [Saprospiraceae bacterium]
MSASAAPSSEYKARLSSLRSAMQSANIHAVILPSADPHQSEYVAERWSTRTYISGFSGSAGTAVVTLEGGGVWTDSRYFVQGPRELERTSGLAFMKSGQGTAEYIDWLAEELPDGATVGIDGKLFTVSQVRMIEKKFDATSLNLQTDVDLIDQVWSDRPSMPTSTLFSHDVKYAGKSDLEKLGDLREQMTAHGLSHTFLSSLDEIAWLLNIRASDIKCNPLAIAYAMVGLDRVDLFTAPDRIDDETRTRFDASNIHVHPYAVHSQSLMGLDETAKVGIDEGQVNSELASLVSDDQYVVFASPIRLAKAMKNKVEIAHIREAHIKDGVALVRSFRWLEHALRTRTVRECEMVDKLHEERAKQPLFYGDSFDAIVGYGENGALPHYHSVPGEDAEIKDEGVLLVDSGGQYLDGTTDITRTFGLGKVTDEQRTRYTLVLKGHIALSRALFPTGTRGIQLDTFARQHLWQQGLNFGHGTGHGVGFFLNVHEAPNGIAPTLSERGKTGFVEGMFSSNEPGFYKEGEYGIRIENLILAVPAFPEEEENDPEKFLRFETITYYPIDYLLLEPDLLTQEERDWLNAYHDEVYERLSPKLNEEECEWLKERCSSL